MKLNIYLEPKLKDQDIAQEATKSAEYFAKLCPAIGGIAIRPLCDSYKDLLIKNFVSGDVTQQVELLQMFNKNENNLNAIHLIGIPEKLSIPGASALNLGNFAIVGFAGYMPTRINQPIIHELGHAMGLVQQYMPNYYADSNELAGGDSANHCFSPFCIMSVRNIDPEHQASRYADYKTNPESVFCKDCKDYLQTAKLQELPWYNQVKN